MSSEYKYDHLSTTSTTLPPLEDIEDENLEPVNHWVPRNQHQLRHWIAHAGNLLIILGLLVFLVRSKSGSRIAALSWDMHNYYPPVNAALRDEPYVTQRFNGSLWHDTPFKGPPSPAVDDAWHSVMKYGMIAVSASDYQRVNHSTRTAVKFPPEAGGGYMATTVGTHQLHCLHYVWQDHHREYYPDVLRKIQSIPELYERHYEHCIDYIRQSLMCNFDVGLVTYDWVLQHQNPTPNSNTMHKCVNWEVVQKWLQERAVKTPKDFIWRQPEGQESLPWNP